jgi:hypothetical protein
LGVQVALSFLNFLRHLCRSFATRLNLLRLGLPSVSAHSVHRGFVVIAIVVVIIHMIITFDTITCMPRLVFSPPSGSLRCVVGIHLGTWRGSMIAPLTGQDSSALVAQRVSPKARLPTSRSLRGYCESFTADSDGTELLLVSSLLQKTALA